MGFAWLTYWHIRVLIMRWLSLLPLLAFSCADENKATHEDLFYAMAEVESGSDDNAVGDDGASRGRYMIQRAYWLDATDYDPFIGGSYNDVISAEYSQKVIEAYMRRYLGDEVWENLTPENIFLIARSHNGGGISGRRNPNTAEYGKRVLRLTLAKRNMRRD